MMIASTTSRRAGRAIVLALTLATLGLGCSSDGSSPLATAEVPAPEQSAPAETTPSETTPPETSPPETSPPAETSPPTENAPATTVPAQSESDSSDTGMIVLIILGVVLLGALIVALMSRRSKSAPATGDDRARLDGVLSGGRTMHDSTSLAVLTAEPAQLQASWNMAQRELIELESQAGALASVVTDAAAVQVLQALGSSTAGLRGALEANVNIRLASGDVEQRDVLDASNETALARRMDFESALQQAAYLRL